MKKFTTLFILSLLFFVSMQAQDIQRQPRQQQSKLSISNFYIAPNIRVSIDGKVINLNSNKAGDEFVTDISSGNHAIKIWSMPVRTRGAYSSQAIRVLYDENVFIRGGYFADIVINRFGRIFKDEQQLEGNNDPGPYPAQGQNHYPGYNPVMETNNFNALKATLKNEAFDASRLNIAKQAGAANFFSAAQVKEIVQLFSFDNSKLEIAKALYGRTTDKGNYFIVNDAFSYSSSKDELMAFIRQNP